jgi:hypothetical protein
MTTLVNDGLKRRAELANGVSTTPFEYLALGRSDMAEANDQSTLGDEVTTLGGERALATTLEYEADYKAKWGKTWTFSGALGFNEYAVFDHATLQIVEDCEDAWDELVDGDVTSTADADCKVGTKSAKLAVAAAVAAGDILATEVVGSMDLSSYKHINLWIKSSVELALGDMQLLLDDTAQCASPLKLLDIPALSAATWTLIRLDLGDASGLTAIISVGIKQVVDKGAFDLYVDHVHCPGEMLMRHKYSAQKNVQSADTYQLTLKGIESRA